MYHRGHSNQSIRYNNQHNNMKRINAHKFGNVSLSPHSYNNLSLSPRSPRSSSPTLSYELPYQPQLSANRKNVSAKTPKQMQFMSKITEESNHHLVNHIIQLTPTPPPPPTPPTHCSPIAKNTPTATMDKHERRNCAKHSIQKTRHYSDEITVDPYYKWTENSAQIHQQTQPPKMINSTSNRSYRKYKTRKTHKKHKKHKHYNSDSHHILAQPHKHKSASKSKRKKHRDRAHSTSTVLSENNSTIAITYMHDGDDAYYYAYESKQSSQDSYAAKLKTQKHNRPQTARDHKRTSKHNKIRSNGTVITPNKAHGHNHYKSQSDGHKIHSQTQTKSKTKGKSKLVKKKSKKSNFNQEAMDYMSAEQQLLYLYDYTSGNVLNRSSASVTSSNTQTRTRTHTRTSERDALYDATSSFSNRRHGNNSDAITPQSELNACSSPVISYPMEAHTLPITSHSHSLHVNSHSLQFLTSPAASKYSQLSTRAVTYSPANRPLYQRSCGTSVRDEYYIECDTNVPNLPSPHYLFKLDSNSEDNFNITPFNKNDEYVQRNPTIVIDDSDPEPEILEQHESHLLEIPASLTAEESGACYLEGEGMKVLEGMDVDDSDNDSMQFPTTPPIYRLYINDKEWDVPVSNPKTPSHRLRQHLLRNSKLQCII